MNLTFAYPPGVNTLYGVRAHVDRAELFKVLASVKNGSLPLEAAAAKIQKLAMAFPYKTREHADYTKAARLSAKRLDGPEWMRPAQLELKINLYRPRRAGDVDGPLKTLLDTGQGLIYENDDQIAHLDVWRHDDKDNPRVEIVATKLDLPGEQDELFEVPRPPERTGAVVTEQRRPITPRELAARAKPNVVRSPTRNEE